MTERDRAKRLGARRPKIQPDALSVGRPTAYEPKFAEQARKLCGLGATDADLADFFEVSMRSIYRWALKHEEFCHALKSGKETSDERVQRSLYHRAIGYSFDAVKILMVNGEPQSVPYREHVPPDTTAAIFWLKNRRPKEWRDKQEVEHSGFMTPGVMTLEQLVMASFECRPAPTREIENGFPQMVIERTT
jgi:hypothetical protein